MLILIINTKFNDDNKQHVKLILYFEIKLICTCAGFRICLIVHVDWNKIT